MRRGIMKAFRPRNEEKTLKKIVENQRQLEKNMAEIIETPAAVEDAASGIDFAQEIANDPGLEAFAHLVNLGTASDMVSVGPGICRWKFKWRTKTEALVSILEVMNKSKKQFLLKILKQQQKLVNRYQLLSEKQEKEAKLNKITQYLALGFILLRIFTFCLNYFS